MGKIKIEESKLELADGRLGKIAVLTYVGEDDPVAALDSAVSSYAKGVEHIEFVDMNLDNPWVRVVMSDVNNMKQEDFDPTKHNLL